MFKSHTREELKSAVSEGLTIYALVIDGEIDDLLIADREEDLQSVVQDVLYYYEVDELPENMDVTEYRGITKLLDTGIVKVTNRQSVVLNGRKTCIFDVYRLIDNSWEYSGQFDGGKVFIKRG